MKTIAIPYSIFFFIFVSIAFLSQPSSGSEDDAIEEIVVLGELVDGLGLRQSAEAASRIGLSLLETPSSVAIISGSRIQTGNRRCQKSPRCCNRGITSSAFDFFYSRFYQVSNNSAA